MIAHQSTFINSLLKKLIAPLAGLALLAPVASINTQASPIAERSAPISGFNLPEPWHGKRPLLLLPLQFDASFNLDQKQFSALESYAEQTIQQELINTNKFSVFQANAHSPALMRAVLDEKVTRDQINTLVKSPTLENANGVLTAMQFDTAPLIAVFSLGKITTYSLPPKNHQPQVPIVQAQVTGKLYNLNDTTAIKTVTMTSDWDPRNQKGFWPNDRLLMAINNASAKVAHQFVVPAAPVNLPVPVGPAYPEKIKLNNAKPITWVEPKDGTKAQ